LAQGRESIRLENEELARRKAEIDKKIAKVDAKANPYRDKREEFARVKGDRPVDMGVETRQRGQVFAGEEIVNAHTRMERDDESAPESSTGQAAPEIADQEKQKAVFDDFLTEAIMASLIVKEKETADQAQKEKMRVFLAALKDLNERRGQTQKQDEDKYKLARTASQHTIYKVGNYSELNADTLAEADNKFLELTRRLWTELTVHEKPDLDANSCLKLMELAGIKLDNVSFVPKGETADSGIIMDTSEKHGVIAEEKGKRLIFDHHGKESDRTTSATKFVYETLVRMGLLQKEGYLDKFVDFVTACDTLEFSPASNEDVLKNYARSMYGLHMKMKLEDILQMMKDDIDPAQEIPKDRLEQIKYANHSSGKEESLAEFSEYFQNKIKRGDRMIRKIEKDGFVLDTGDDRFGKILIDTSNKTDKNKWRQKVDAENHSDQLSVFAKGYGAYIKWSPGENSFAIFSRDKKMDEEMIPGGFGQGFNRMGYMWIKSRTDEDPLTLTLKDILAKLSGQADFKIEGKLKKALDIDGKSKEMLDLLDEGRLTEDALRKASGDLKINLGILLGAITSQRDKLKKQYSKFKKNNKAAADDLMVKALTGQPIGQSPAPAGQPSQTAGQPAQQPPAPAQQPPSAPPSTPPVIPPVMPQQPPAPSAMPASPDKLDVTQLEDEIKKISADFGVNINYDQITNEKDNRLIISAVKEALQAVDHKKLSGLVESIALHSQKSSTTNSGDKIILRYTLTAPEMAKKLAELMDKAIEKQKGVFEKRYGIKPEYNDIFHNVKSQMNKQNVAKEAQRNFFDLLKRVVESDDLDEADKKKLERIIFIFSPDEKADLPNNIEAIEVGDHSKNVLNISLGSENQNVFLIDDMANGFAYIIREL
ncbi:MAG: hypothetical protein Q8L10_01555, partial [Candidatus Moranbacteria bacterium]|nr:hypothetical protein [Candidatus Moranbacteria bacterium]